MTFTPSMLDTLRRQYGKLETVPTSAVEQFRALFARCDTAAIGQLAAAGIKFVSVLAANEARRRLAAAEAAQPRLPSDVGAVRDLEIAHPTFDVPKADPDAFDLTAESVEHGRKQSSLF